MNADKQRIAIAEACGWKTIKTFPASYYAIPPDGTLTEDGGFSEHSAKINGYPDYPNDLNAMHDAVSCLSGDRVIRFCEQLSIVTGAGEQSLRQYQTRLMVMANAEQWAEAFLREIGKWEEGHE